MPTYGEYIFETCTAVVIIARTWSDLNVVRSEIRESECIFWNWFLVSLISSRESVCGSLCGFIIDVFLFFFMKLIVFYIRLCSMKYSLLTGLINKMLMISSINNISCIRWSIFKLHLVINFGTYVLEHFINNNTTFLITNLSLIIFKSNEYHHIPSHIFS